MDSVSGVSISGIRGVSGVSGIRGVSGVSDVSGVSIQRNVFVSLSNYHMWLRRMVEVWERRWRWRREEEEEEKRRGESRVEDDHCNVLLEITRYETAPHCNAENFFFSFQFHKINFYFLSFICDISLCMNSPDRKQYFIN